MLETTGESVMFCAQCGSEIEPDSKFCRYCGTSQPADVPAVEQPQPLVADTSSPPPTTKGASTSSILIGTLIVLAVVGTIAMMSKNNQPMPESDQVTADALSAASEAIAAADAAAALSSEKPSESSPASNWSYSTDEDKISGATTYYASTTSTNQVFQSSPYESETSGRLIVRKSPAHGTDVMFQISSGQLMCPSYDTCSGRVRFDDGAAQSVQFNGAADNSSETIFVVGAKGFIAKLKKAKHVVVEKTLYQAGNPQFEFDVSGLAWDH